MRSSGLVGIYARDARIGETNHVCNVEDQGKHDDGDESAMSYDESAQEYTMQFAPFTID
jgi:hypothetical protein